MNLLGITKCKIEKDENCENVPNLEITEMVLVYCNIVNNNYQQRSRVLYIFVPNKSFDLLLDISPKKKKNFLKHLIQSFHILKYGLNITIIIL